MEHHDVHLDKGKHEGQQYIRDLQYKDIAKKINKNGDKGDLCWTEAGERLARRMLKYLEDSKSTKVGMRELEEQVLFPFESGSDMAHIARRVKNEKRQKLFQIPRQGEDEILKASKARWDAQLRGLVELERLYQSLRAEVEYQCESKRGFWCSSKRSTS